MAHTEKLYSDEWVTSPVCDAINIGDAGMAKILINTSLILLFLLSLPFIAFSEEIYEYERMWPLLEQPWYFIQPYSVAVDSSDNVYVADSDNNRIQKFTSNGQFITKWGTYGSGNGQFNFGEFNYYNKGIAIDSSGNVYVADTFNYRIQKFTSDGQFIIKWGSYGSGDGQLNEPSGIAVDKSDNVYVNDSENHRIQKFTSDGQFITKWGSYGSEDGQFRHPYGIAIDSSDYVYVTDLENYRIQKFTSNGQFIAKWGDYGQEDGEFRLHYGLTVDSSGNVYVADSGNSRIQKFTSDGQFVTKWESYGNGDGQFIYPYGIALDSSGTVYVADSGNGRIQKFTSDGQFVTKWGNGGSGDGQFIGLSGIVVDSTYLYVVDSGNSRIQKFTSDGQFIAKWGTYGNGDGQFSEPFGIAVDGSGYVYVADTYNHRIQKFTSNGQFVTKWGSQGRRDGQFYYPEGIAVDSNDYVYVSEMGNNRIQKFTSNGQFIAKWGDYGEEDGQLFLPYGLTVDSSGNVYVADSGNSRIQKFTSDGQFITKWGKPGSNQSEFFRPFCVGVNSNGRAYVADNNNHRIQVFSKVTELFKNKAIIVAGSGPYKGNNLWDATEMIANYAYRVLNYQGYTNDTIYYLSSDRNLDFNNDGKPDVDADATNSNLQSAITQWAKDAESLVLYLTGHGADGTFEMSETEILKAEDLASWLNELHQTMQGLVTVIYDACESGSFVSKFAPPSVKQRILITSTSPGEPAYFLSQGALSFSYQFWSQIFGGAKIYNAYVMAKDVVGVAIGAGKSQNPEIDDNGNGIGNEKTDGDVARDTYIGKGIVTAGSIPHISSISPDQVLNGQTSATITVEVVSAEKIIRVWAVFHSPDFSTTPGSPITELPSFDLTSTEQTTRYAGTYNGFTVKGTYTITVYAMNKSLIISLPKTTKIEQIVSDQYTLTVTIAPSSAAGSVSKNPNKSIYTNGEAVTLTVSPNSGYTFTNWTGDVPNPPNPNSSIQIIMNGTKKVTANFIQNQYTLTVNIAPPGTGSVTKNPDKASYGYGEMVLLAATTNPGFTFTNWSGDASGSTNPVTLTMDGNKIVTANFTVTNGPDISVTPLTYDFENVKVKKSKSASFKVQNNGKANLTIATLIIGPDASMFTLTSGGGNKTIKPGKFTTIKVKFKPTSTGSRASTLKIVSNDPDEPTIDIPLIGAGL